MALHLSRIEARLEFILQGPKESSGKYYHGILVCEKLKLQAATQQRVKFAFPVPFPWGNHLSSQPKGFWRMKLTIVPEHPRHPDFPFSTFAPRKQWC